MNAPNEVNLQERMKERKKERKIEEKEGKKEGEIGYLCYHFTHELRLRFLSNHLPLVC